MARITVPRRPAGALAVSLLTALVLAGGPAHAASASPGAQVWPLDAQHFDAAKVWALSRGAGVTVAVLDSGVYAAHPDLSGRVLPGIDITDQAGNGSIDTTSDSHGSSVAGVIAATGASGGAGG